MDSMASFWGAIRARPILGLLAGASVFLGAAFPAAAEDAPAVIRVTRHGASVSADNALIAEVRVSLTGAARVFVEYDNPQAGRYRTAPTEPGAAHVIPIVRLRPQTTYDYTIFVVDGADRAAAATGPHGRFTTGALPPLLAELRIQAHGRSSLPLIQSNYRRRNDRRDHYVFWDETGATVWYHDGIASGTPIRQLPGGTFLFSERGNLTEITPLGEVVNRVAREEAGTPHHELTLLDDGRVIYPGREVYVFDDSANGGADEAIFLVDNLRIWDPARGAIEQVWDAKAAWDIRDPAQRLPGPVRDDGSFSWTHVNSVSFGPGGNVILSVRGRNQVVALSPDFRTIEWQLSGPDSDFRFPNPADRFYGQHTATQLANGNVLVFDNGFGRPDSEGGLYSRALELRLDAAAGTAVKVWEYRLDPDFFAPRGGSAYRLGNGHTLINFSNVPERLAHVPLTVVEVDAAGAEVFRLETMDDLPPADRARSRATGGVESIMGETMLRPPAAGRAIP